jgi:type IV secretory pathway VirB4 component
MPERARFEHSHVIGTTGGGKTNLLEHLIRQDIKRGDGVCVIDPHGSHPDSLYRSLITWLAASGHLARRKVYLIDPNVGSHTTGFNPLALPSDETSVSVVAGVALEAIERVWGDAHYPTAP